MLGHSVHIAVFSYLFSVITVIHMNCNTVTTDFCDFIHGLILLVSLCSRHPLSIVIVFY